MPIVRILKSLCLCGGLAAGTLPAIAQHRADLHAPVIHVVYMGGDDCPPCKAWRQSELPKLEKTEAFKSIRFSYVLKSIRSAVPARFFLPAEVKPYKEQLDAASAGRTGSPHFALIVNGAVYDYYFGTRSAASVEEMILAVQNGDPYPFDRCLKLSASTGQCAVKG